LKTNGQVPIEVVMREIRSDRLQPGQKPWESWESSCQRPTELRWYCA
jgi:hypothetical protein